MDTIREIAKVPTNLNEHPRIPVTIMSCGKEEIDKESDSDSD